MSTNRRSQRTKAATHPPAAPAAMIRNTELIGVDEDGNMSLWATGNVQPLTALDGNGHYVIQWKNHAITVHCSSRSAGLIDVQFMCSRNWCIFLPRAEVEAMLLGKVIPAPEHQARIMLMFDKIAASLHARNQAPHRRRGRI